MEKAVPPPAEPTSPRRDAAPGKVAKKGVIVLSVLLAFCMLGNWAIKEFRSAAGTHHPDGAGGLFCPQEAENSRMEQGMFQQVYCPTIALPGLHGILILNQ